jgi:PAS domain S-box-containing protein
MTGVQYDRAFLDDSPIPCHEIDAAGTMIYVNAAECELLRLDTSQLLGHPVWEFVAEADRDASRQAVERKLAGKQALVSFERKYTRSDGATLVLEIYEKHMLDRDGRIRGIRSFLLDITERLRAEQALQLNEKRFRHLMEHSSDIVYGADIHGRFVFFNPAATVLLGYDPEQIVGRSYLDLVRPDFRAQTRRFYRAQLAQNIGDTYFEFPAMTRDGSELWFGQNVQLVREGDRTIGFQAITRDITRQHRTEEQERHLRDELERRVLERTAELQAANALLRREMEERQKAEEQRKRLEAQIQHAQRLESLGVLAGGIAHDFNNLLTAIMGHASVALYYLTDASPARASIDAVVSASTSAAQLTQQMLAYSGRGKFVVESINLTHLVEETSRFAASLLSKKATVRFNLAADLPLLQGDIAQVRQVLINLLTNASEALNDKPGWIDVNTGSLWASDQDLTAIAPQSALPAGQYVYLEVADSGCGMDQEILGRIFDPFFTTKFTGRGLGLAAVVGIVRGHSGTLQVQSKVGEGSRFRALFPASQDAEPAPVYRGESDQQEWRGHGLVLVVDDEPTVRDRAAATLRRTGLDVITAVDGHDAIRQFTEHREEIRAVVLDMTMPGLDGIEVMQQISQINPEAKVFLCSGYNLQDLKERLALKGLAGFLRKPYLPRELIRCMCSAFQERE